jgi:hypothetical protein
MTLAQRIQLTSTTAGAFPVFGPEMFNCTIKPRSEAAAALVREQANVDRPQGLEDSSVYDQLYQK